MLILLLFCVFLASDVGAACPEQPDPGSAWIVFASFRGGDFASSLFAIKPDGTGECRISTHESGRPSVLDPAVSADGSRVAFARGGGDHQTSVWTMRRDGSQEKELARNVIVRFNNGRAAPVWSPDGRRIAFVADGDGGRVIRMMKADGSELRDLHSGTFPAWSRDGSRIAFSAPLGSDGATAVWTIGSDGSAARRLTDETHSDYPDWSPDGKRLVFSRQVGERFDLFVMNADGKDLRQLTNTPGVSEIQASWSPDGSTIAFVARPPDSPDGWQRSVFVVPAKGGEARQVTASQYNDLSPSWMLAPKAEH